MSDGERIVFTHDWQCLLSVLDVQCGPGSESGCGCDLYSRHLLGPVQVRWHCCTMLYGVLGHAIRTRYTSILWKYIQRNLVVNGGIIDAVVLVNNSRDQSVADRILSDNLVTEMINSYGKVRLYLSAGGSTSTSILFVCV